MFDSLIVLGIIFSKISDLVSRDFFNKSEGVHITRYIGSFRLYEQLIFWVSLLHFFP